MIFVVYVVMTLTGLVLYAVSAPIGSPFRIFDALTPIFGGLPIARLIHHIGMWVIMIFAVAPHLLRVAFVGHRTYRNV